MSTNSPWVTDRPSLIVYSNGFVVRLLVVVRLERVAGLIPSDTFGVLVDTHSDRVPTGRRQTVIRREKTKTSRVDS